MRDELLAKLRVAERAVTAAEQAAMEASLLVYGGKGAEHAARLARCARMKAELAVARAHAAAVRAELAAVGLSAHERVRLRSIIARGIGGPV